MRIQPSDVPVLVESYDALAHAYFLAGRAAVSALQENVGRRVESGAVVYPAALLLRHALELALKSVIFALQAHRGVGLQRQHASLFSPRSLRDLSRRLAAEIRRSKFGFHFPAAMLARIDRVCGMLTTAELQTSAVGFRYPSIMDGGLSDPPLGDHEVLVADVDAILSFLFGVGRTLAASGYPGAVSSEPGAVASRLPVAANGIARVDVR